MDVLEALEEEARADMSGAMSLRLCAEELEDFSSADRHEVEEKEAERRASRLNDIWFDLQGLL